MDYLIDIAIAEQARNVALYRVAWFKAYANSLLAERQDWRKVGRRILAETYWQAMDFAGDWEEGE